LIVWRQPSDTKIKILIVWRQPSDTKIKCTVSGSFRANRKYLTKKMIESILWLWVHNPSTHSHFGRNKRICFFRVTADQWRNQNQYAGGRFAN
jgi:hypothetical protein